MLTSLRHHALGKPTTRHVEWIETGTPLVPIDCGQVELTRASGPDAGFYNLVQGLHNFRAQLHILWQDDGPEVDHNLALYITAMEDAIFVARALHLHDRGIAKQPDVPPGFPGHGLM